MRWSTVVLSLTLGLAVAAVRPAVSEPTHRLLITGLAILAVVLAAAGVVAKAAGRTAR